MAQKQLSKLIDFLEDVADDEKERYILKSTDSHGTYQEIVGRKEYLQFVVESTLQNLRGIQEELEQTS